MSRAYYAKDIAAFLKEDPFAILGQLANQHPFDLEEKQKSAWQTQIKILKNALSDCTGHIFFEFSIPRMAKRADVVLLVKGIIFVLEFKVGENSYSKYALDQVMDYALDLKNFHQTSHKLPIVPILVATEAKTITPDSKKNLDGIYEPLLANSKNLGDLISEFQIGIDSANVDAEIWEKGQYKPTPTIIEAAQALYLGHSVKDITRSDAGAVNLNETSDAVDRIIMFAKENHKKVICFITGVPGAGKTLAGLNVANDRLKNDQDEHAVFLSGNGPLVKVLQEALVRDDIKKGEKRKDAERKAQAFIQNFHHFRDEYFENESVPIEQVVIFDEAQRAWNVDMAAKFMKKRKGVLDFNKSEPEFLIEVMNRHQDWATIICLIGGGQEINQGEAGLSEWFHALKNSFPEWQVYVSQQITDSEYLMGQKPNEMLSGEQLKVENKLHLSVSVRSYRSEKVSDFIKAILDNDCQKAQSLVPQILPNYPIYLTRDLRKAKTWVHQKARGSERFGLLASSGAERLRPEGLFVKAKIEVEHWFLDDRFDVRSSYALEEASTEFDIQGLELDWAIVGWDADFRHDHGDWSYRNFKGSKWQNINDNARKMYLKNAYRVLLTRSRQGMVIFIPSGDQADETRLPIFYDGTYQFLQKIGIPEI